MKAITMLTTTLLLLSVVVFGQNRRYYHKNTFDKTFTKCQQPPTFGTDSADLQKYFADKLQAQILKTKGKIKIGVLIDTTGKTLCEWIDNSSNFKINKEKLDEIIDTMPNWNYGIQNGHKVNCAAQIELTFNRQNIGATFNM